MITVNITGDEKVRSMLQRIDEIGKTRALALTAVEIERYVEGEVDKHTKTGALFQSVFSRKQSDGSFLVGNDLQRAPHAVFVHWGTKAHEIRPTKKKALRWASGGEFFFAKLVHHPGNKADPWVKRAAALAPKIFEQHVVTLLRKV